MDPVEPVDVRVSHTGQVQMPGRLTSAAPLHNRGNSGSDELHVVSHDAGVYGVSDWARNGDRPQRRLAMQASSSGASVNVVSI